jgi:PEGA domain
MKKTLLLLALLGVTYLFAAEFVVTSFQEQSMSIELQRNPVKDVNGEYAALIKISTDLLPFTFETNIGVVKTEKKVGEYWAYVPKGTSQLIFSKDGFNRYRFTIPITVKANTVYSMIMSSKGYGVDLADKNLINITFKLQEEGIYISKDNSSPIESQNKLVEYRLPIGNYDFKFFKGSRSFEKLIDVKEDALFEIVLSDEMIDTEIKLPGIIKVISSPENAEIFIDNQKFGNTPFQFSISSGKHVLKLMKNLYYSYTTNIEVEAGKVLELPEIELLPNFGSISITTTPDSCNVILDNKVIGISPLQDYRIISGQHNLVVEKHDFLDKTESIIIANSDTLRLDLSLQYAFGKLKVNSRPEDGAAVFIDGNEVGKTPYFDAKMRVGKYLIGAEKEHWIGSEAEVMVQSDETTIKEMILNQNFAELSVKATNSEIYIDNEYSGKDSLYKRLPAGKHNLEARIGEFLRDYQEIFCLTGEKKNIILQPEPQYASLSIISTPQATEGADVYINGELGGTTPLVKKVFMGKNEVLLKHPLYNPHKTLIKLENDEQKALTIDLELYKGSSRHKADNWNRSKWISLASTILISGAGVYSNMQGDGYLEDYDNATSTASAISNWDDMENWYSRRDICYGVSIAPAVWFVYSWVKEMRYNKQAKK